MEADGPDHETTHDVDSRQGVPNTLVPIGTQNVRIPPLLRDDLQSSAASGRPLDLEGTRVWIGYRKGELVLHLGDVDISTLDI